MRSSLASLVIQEHIRMRQIRPPLSKTHSLASRLYRHPESSPVSSHSHKVRITRITLLSTHLKYLSCLLLNHSYQRYWGQDFPTARKCRGRLLPGHAFGWLRWRRGGLLPWLPWLLLAVASSLPLPRAQVGESPASWILACAETRKEGSG